MKAFLVGLLSLIIVGLFFWFGILLFPLLLVLGVVVRIILAAILVLVAIWLLGTFILYLFSKVR